MSIAAPRLGERGYQCEGLVKRSFCSAATLRRGSLHCGDVWREYPHLASGLLNHTDPRRERGALQSASAMSAAVAYGRITQIS